MPKTAVTRITHSCHLVEMGGRTFLTDPWFSTRPGSYQDEPIAIGVPDLPRLDGVLISHEHYGHGDLDLHSPRTGTVVEAARKHGFTNVTALAPWQEAEVGGVTITATPAEHGVYEVTFVLRSGADADYAFTKGFLGDRLITRSDRNPLRYQDAARDLAPGTSVRIVEPGIRIEL
ncbi:MBL fold metallo-hydrolase [Streptomyces sp. 3213.3]|uniref:MBL fold metallo-hydrolase n=1 Tax=Streptomyces sp. 3213.3 TaxID=1855348 RepID=UPI000B8576FA|nr:MBL fold metallo-hydrolase [Streptomyces sp. 3213.3]